MMGQSFIRASQMVLPWFEGSWVNCGVAGTGRVQYYSKHGAHDQLLDRAYEAYRHRLHVQNTRTRMNTTLVYSM